MSATLLRLGTEPDELKAEIAIRLLITPSIKRI